MSRHVTSTITIKRSRAGTTIRATGAAAQRLFDAVARQAEASVGQTVKPSPGAPWPSFQQWLADVELRLTRRHGFTADAAGVAVETHLWRLVERYESHRNAEDVAAALAMAQPTNAPEICHG